MKFYGLNPSDLPNIFVTNALLRPIKNAGRQEVYTQLITTKKSRHLSDTDLIHRVTTTQIRLRMNVPADPERWIVEPRRERKYEMPDAEYITPDGERWAIEADTGHYDWLTVQRKIDSFQDQEYARTIWGSLSELRIKNLGAKLSDRSNLKFELAKWW